MKRFFAGTVLTLFVLLFAFSGTVGAAYNSSGDIKISLTSKLIPIKLSNTTAQLTFEVQESLHNTLTQSTGIELDHSYIWINVNGVDVLAIDPPKPCFN